MTSADKQNQLAALRMLERALVDVERCLLFTRVGAREAEAIRREIKQLHHLTQSCALTNSHLPSPISQPKPKD